MMATDRLVCPNCGRMANGIDLDNKPDLWCVDCGEELYWE